MASACHQTPSLNLSVYRRSNPSAAEKYASELQAACEALEHFPERAPKYNRRYRALVFRNHLVFYRYDQESGRVYITAIIDARQDVDRLVRHLKNE